MGDGNEYAGGHRGGANGYSVGLAPMNPHTVLGWGIVHPNHPRVDYVRSPSTEDVTFRGAPPGPPMTPPRR